MSKNHRTWRVAGILGVKHPDETCWHMNLQIETGLTSSDPSKPSPPSQSAPTEVGADGLNWTPGDAVKAEI